MPDMKSPDGKRTIDIKPAGVEALKVLGWELVETSTPEAPAEDQKGPSEDAEQDTKPAPRRRTTRKE